MLFLVETSPSPYNAILGHPWIHEVARVTSTYHQKIKILTPHGVVEILGEQLVARQCQLYLMSNALDDVATPTFGVPNIVLDK